MVLDGQLKLCNLRAAHAELARPTGSRLKHFDLDEEIAAGREAAAA